MFVAFPGFDPVWAEQDSTGEYRLGEVLVSAPKATAEAIQTSQTVTAQDIKDRGARTLGEAIELSARGTCQDGRRRNTAGGCKGL